MLRYMPTDREPLSVAVITRDEERNLARCLASVAWAEEILVVDSGSTDATATIAARYGARFLVREWSGYVEQKNFALDQVHHAWVLSLDADEWLSAEAAEEIRQVLHRPRAEAYALSRLTSFSGAFVRHVWRPDWQVRLLLRERGRFAGGRVHESLRMTPGARIERLRHPLLHLGYRSIADYVRRMNRYTDLAAADLKERGRLPWLRLLLSPPATFLKLYVWKRGFLDGVRGLTVSAGSAFYVLLKYAKLWELGRDPDAEFIELSTGQSGMEAGATVPLRAERRESNDGDRSGAASASP